MAGGDWGCGWVGGLGVMMVMVSVRLVVLMLALGGVEVEVGGLEWRVEANLGDGHCWIGVAIAGWHVA